MKTFVVFLFFLISLTYVSCATSDDYDPEECDDPNAEYLDCKRCVGSCDNLNPVCTASCEPAGCYCKEGYTKKSKTDSTCVPRRSCFNCPSNEEYQECGTACPKTCENYPFYNTINCIALCVEGCFCKSGLVRDTNTGKCVPYKSCTQQCTKPNQVYSKCGANGCQNTCRNPTFASVCKGPCVAGCICKQGYLKNSKGDCVLPKDCKECYGVNEVWTECDNNSCQRNCKTFGLTNLACKPICNPGCICKKGYLRNSKGVCVTPPKCGTKLCPEANTEYTDCVPCDNTCEIYATNGTCNFLVCNIGCTCKKGFYYNSKNQCVPPQQCDYCKENAVFSKCDNHPCRDTCSNPTFSTVCRYDNSKCYPGCICEEGYLKNSQGDCVPEEQCVSCTKPNEVFSDCDNHDCQDTCENPRFSWACSYVHGCYPGCICKDGYLRTRNGYCVPRAQCPPKCKDPNAFFNGCGDSCALTCKNKDDPPACPAFCISGSGRCECNPGYAFNDKGICIKVEDCPALCPVNEIYKNCGIYCPVTCDNKTANPREVCSSSCIEGCVCKDGYIRDNQSGKCVLPENCPGPLCPNFNEYYSKCDAHPCISTCENPDLAQRCRYIPGCYPGCLCDDGYLRNEKGVCVPEEECPKKAPVQDPSPCTDSNSKWHKCKPCVGRCDKPVTACNVACIPGCACNDGFVMKSKTDKTCVPLNKCPNKKPPKCGANEVWSESCLVAPETCENDANPKLGKKPGCCCNPGYIREYDGGDCIPEDECW